MEPPDIERLDERTVQRIAAGEVVERPASVVKELVENSLDAGASRVAVSVESGGTEGIRVRDDGVGIPEDQLDAAVAEHATSKIGDIEDLDRGVGTLGFRGEALYTVGAVSRLTVRSRPPDAEAGAEITVEGGEVGEVRPAGCPAGTTVEVNDLFFNTPAREKFLKRTATEFDHVNTVVTSYALANPDVAVSLEHDGRETFATEGNGDLRSAVLAVYGREVAESMIDVDWTPEGSETDGAADADGAPVERVTGLVSHPETARSTRDYLSTYVNGRYVTASALREATLDAYGGQLAPDRYPFAVLFVEVPAGDVDVNVHPRKLEVRFDEEPAVRAAVETAVEDALLDHGLIRSTAPRGQSAPDETAVAPETPDVEAVGGADTGHERAAREGRERATESAASGDPTDAGGGSEDARDGEVPRADDDTDRADENAARPDDDTDRAAAAEGDDDPSAPTELDPADDAAWSVDGLGGEGASTDGPAGERTGSGRTDAGGDARPSPRSWQADSADRDGEPPTETDEVAGATGDSAETLSDAAEQGSDSPAGEEEDNRSPAEESSRPSPRARPATRQRTLGGEGTEREREFDSLPSLRVLGQLHETYVVAEAPDGLVLIDQHAADERVNYERLKAAFADGADAQALAEPVRIELTAREAALFEEFVDDLAGIGFRAERAGEREVAVTAVPAVFDAALDPDLLRDALSALVDDAAAGDEPVADAVDELLADLACYPSVTGNTSLTEGRVVDLLDRLDACENPYACPHGRPVVIRLDREEIGSRFERDYPGHGGRRAE
ncbi:DNA mismatch repair endonuclease MutL [Halorubrum sp. Atlit-8R]|uniref:DNA mismatch repair endonuclease MutL n=1 Tax=unclassified Halorubrum TaxID=2642239 RepID=UPI000EF250B5|nr:MULTISPECIES: DNA mismatch repair endonuclease MutL [unclassified Halorubrum]RLM71218.1 DNA mismatch repair endonuclease MutL [Halorubrum sp. Atlit-9R]RLM72086.1 DNA mismatch repair endonuclease MutL [Halorubrum sp. Atlit-9R]RLM82630.1 DNA mismatch repair endonuclease MutL [Halorubrum sp. Atlit-8R]